MTTGISVKRATKELEMKQSTETTAKPETYTEQNTCQHYTWTAKTIDGHKKINK